MQFLTSERGLSLGVPGVLKLVESIESVDRDRRSLYFDDTADLDYLLEPTAPN
ncbi:hypothetical protein [Microcoleus sp. CAWBG58]|uniref:hypothetical protein n=1 Tax=Microcoleus sp. CAWBG58 TaxID=2841651 RepID=UPI0025F875BF|nr:hypothetical protein [Microcoleus sp. CAWBG58]